MPTRRPYENRVYRNVVRWVYAIALGYEDLNDHEALRSDPVLQALFAAAYANLKAIPLFSP